MTNKSVEQRYSNTAEFAASYRAVACAEYPHSAIGSDYYAEKFISASNGFLVKFAFIRQLGIKRSARFTPGGFEYVLARSAYFDRQLLKAVEGGAKQVVILGAGFDTRAYRFAKECSQCKIIELDIATTQNRKKQCLRKANIPIPNNLIFSPINFNLDSLPAILLEAGYDSDVQTVFLWEGVSMYLDPQAVETTLRFIGESKNKKSLLVFDYIAAISETDIDQCYGAKRWRETWAKYRQSEPFTFTIDDSQLTSYLGAVGLSVSRVMNNSDIEAEYLSPNNDKNLGKVTGWFRFVTASLL